MDFCYCYDRYANSTVEARPIKRARADQNMASSLAICRSVVYSSSLALTN